MQVRKWLSVKYLYPMSGVSRTTLVGGARAEKARRDPHALLSILDELIRAEPNLARGWFHRLIPTRFDGGVLRIQAENAAQVDYLRRECGAPLVAAAQTATGRLVSVEFEVAPSRVEAEPPPRQDKTGRTFGDFVVGPGSRFAHASMMAAVEEPGVTYNALFLHGPVGVGKSLLLEAAATALRGKSQELVLHYSAESWTAELVKQFEDGASDVFRRRTRGAAALLVDDVHRLADRPRSLEELFQALNALLGDQRQVIFTADRPPTELTGFPERLIGRFSAGLVAGIDPPDVETRTAILKTIAKSATIEISEAVVEKLAAEGSGSMHDLSAILVRLDAMSRMEAMPISEEMLRRARTNG